MCIRDRALAALGPPPGDLIELFEHALLLGRRDADAGVPDLDAPAQRAIGRAAGATGQQHAALPRVLDGIGQQVAQHTLQQLSLIHI